MEILSLILKSLIEDSYSLYRALFLVVETIANRCEYIIKIQEIYLIYIYEIIW